MEVQELDRVLIAGCTPRLVEKLFRQATGLDSGSLEVTDIREQCAFVHTGESATQKAADLSAMGVARLRAVSQPRAHTGRVVKAAMVIGSGLSGLAAALSLADDGINVTLVEQGGALGGSPPALDARAKALVSERIEAVAHHPRIQTLLNARVTGVAGRPGDYEVHVTSGGDQSTTFAVGAILVAADALPKPLGSDHWYDRARVVTQAEFEAELNGIAGREAPRQPLHDEHASPSARARHGVRELRDIVMILCAEEAGGERCSRLCCLAGIRQAIRAKQASPDANVTILFRDLYWAAR
jgi:heterodisulfide reductase subunit A